MSEEWQLRRCVCGHSFGCRESSSSLCTKCGSPKSKAISNFSDSRQLATAVSNANMPKEIAHDIKKRIQSMEKKSDVYIATNNENPRSRSIQAMRDATDDDGILTIESLEKELAKTGIGETSSHYLIGQAEVEGILVRHDAESWAWL